MCWAPAHGIHVRTDNGKANNMLYETNLVKRIKMSIARSLAVICITMCMSFSSLATAQSVTVRLVNGRNGKPVVKTRVGISFPEQPGKAALELITNRQGEVMFEATGARVFGVSPVLYVNCGDQSPGAPQPKYSVKEVLGTGVLTRNNCGHLNPEPLRGRLLYFVRPVSGWELFKN